jgi:hypothetical protein
VRHADRKTQTTKDLAKPWAAFPSHDARTTLLLDDSALKAHIHPHNHLCVREYLAETRKCDLRVWRAINFPEPKHNFSVPDRDQPGDLEEVLEVAENNVKPKSKCEFKKKPKQTPSLFRSAPAEGAAPPPWVLASGKYDETLLAVIGILETLKTQQDVAHWIRAGELLAGYNASDQTKDDTEQLPPSAESLVSQITALTLNRNLNLPQAQELWFNNEGAVSHWVDRGLHALEALHIDVDVGIHGEVPPAHRLWT